MKARAVAFHPSYTGSPREFMLRMYKDCKFCEARWGNSWQAKAPAPHLRTKVGQTLSSVNPALLHYRVLQRGRFRTVVLMHRHALVGKERPVAAGSVRFRHGGDGVSALQSGHDELVALLEAGRQRGINQIGRSDVGIPARRRSQFGQRSRVASELRVVLHLYRVDGPNRDDCRGLLRVLARVEIG